MRSSIFNAVRKDWEEKVSESKTPLEAVGRSSDNKKLNEIVEDISLKLDLSETDILLEAGCGSGVLLSQLSNKVFQTSGIDYSNNAISIANNNFPEIDFSVAEVATSAELRL